MDEVLGLNLIHLFTFYLAAAFALSTWRRLRQYHDVAQLAVAAPGRWPRVLAQIKSHWIMFLTWATLRPAAVALGLLLAQMVCSRLIWPTANLTLRDLLAEWTLLPAVAVTAAGMLAVDLYFILRVGALDRRETEKYLDEAEHWLTSWKAPIIHVVTLGYINPRQIVAVEVRKAVEEGRGLLHRTLWWMSAQAGLRIVFGLILWVAWAVHFGAASPPLASDTPAAMLELLSPARPHPVPVLLHDGAA
ncbi:MAG TPA: hypothetical protein VKE40_12695 [Gemmataceae bacterium]|nr:hypothetical protein [Gemmataceae bacterium]